MVRLTEQTPNSCQLCDWTESNRVTSNYHRWWGCNKRANLRHVNTEATRTTALAESLFLIQVYERVGLKSSAPANAVSKTCVVVAVDKGERCSLITDFSLAWGPCARKLRLLLPRPLHVANLKKD